MSEPLKPCPFCGSKNVRVAFYNKPSVECDDCYCLGPASSLMANLPDSKSKCKNEAIELWNKRHEENEVCEWEYDELIGAYETKCGHHWEFSSGGPTENKANFCMFCGKKIKII